MTATLGRVVQYWKCSCAWTAEVGQPVARGSWEVPTFDGGIDYLEAAACCPRCGARLKQLEKTTYPVISRPGELVTDGLYYAESRYDDEPPFGGRRFHVRSAPRQPSLNFHAYVEVEVVGSEEVPQQVTLYKLGIPDLASGHRDIYNTTYRVA